MVTRGRYLTSRNAYPLSLSLHSAWLPRLESQPPNLSQKSRGQTDGHPLLLLAKL